MTEFTSLASETLNLCWSRYSQPALAIKADCVVCYWLDLGMLWIENKLVYFYILKVVVSQSLPAAATGTCSEFTYKCKNQVCINKLNAECDRIDDCSDKSDEAACGRKGYQHFYFPKQLKVDLILSPSLKGIIKVLRTGLSVEKEPQALTPLFISFFFESCSCHLWRFCF